MNNLKIRLEVITGIGKDCMSELQGDMVRKWIFLLLLLVGCDESSVDVNNYIDRGARHKHWRGHSVGACTPEDSCVASCVTDSVCCGIKIQPKLLPSGCESD